MKENILLGCLLVVGIGFCLRGIRQNQLGPHQVNHYVAGTLTSVNGYWTTAEGIGIAIILFVVGRKVVKKI